METLGVETIEAVADRGYFKLEDIRSVRGGRRHRLRAQANRDVYLCPGNVVLSPRYFGKIRDNVKIDYINREARPTCALKPRRTTTAFRRVMRL